MGKCVLYHIGSLSPGGAQRQLLYTALAAERRGYKVLLAVEKPSPHYESMLGSSHIEVISLDLSSKSYRLLRRIRSLSVIIKKTKPEIIHSFLPTNNLWAMFLSKLFKVPLKIASIRGTHPRAFDHVRLYHRFADMIICNTQLAKDISNREYCVPKDKLLVVYNAIDLERFRDAKPLQDFRSILGLQPDTKLGVTVARFTEMKNHIGLVRSLGLLEKQGLLENVHYLLCGYEKDKDLYGLVMEEIREMGLSKKITPLGQREDIPEILKCCDFMVLSSFCEGFPNVVIEAMASGVFVIATPTGGTVELVEHGKNALLTRGCTPQDLAEGIKEYLTLDEATGARIRRGALEKATEYDQEKAFNTIFELYEKTRI